MSDLAFFNEGRVHAGMDFATYLETLHRLTTVVPDSSMDETAIEHLSHAAINYRRATRMAKTYVPSAEMLMVIKQISTPQVWMVLSEPWCADSAQSIPVLARIASSTSLVEFRLLGRDANPDIMDRYLTNGSKGIPKLVVFDKVGIELFQWGPRPAAGQAVFLQGAAEGVPKEKRLEKLHHWYAKDAGRSVEQELLALVRQTLD